MHKQLMPLLIALILNSISAELAHAQNEPATETSALPASKVRMVSDILDDGAPDKNGVLDKKSIKRQEIVLDLETASAALQVVSWKHSDNAKEIVAVVPFMENLDPSQATKLARGLSDEAPRSLNRQLAATVYKEFGRDVYWSKHLERLPADAHGKFDRERFELTGFTDLKGKRIVDANGDLIGSLVDMGMDGESGMIIYCVIQSADKSLRAIPLGAFVDRDPKQDWKIELEREQVMLFEPFADEKTPQKIDRGWQEYVAVRYGRNALQTEKKGEINREKVSEQKTKEKK